METLEEILENCFIIWPTACWEWQRGKTGGYGVFKHDGIQRSVHRFVYETLVGSIPEGFDIHHLCHNPACCNPDHLQPVSKSVHVLLGDTVSAKNLAKTHCDRNHPLDGSNLITDANGKRRCRICRRFTERERYKRQRRPDGTASIPNAAKTHCKRGHPFDEENTLIITPSKRLPNGGRKCRVCAREYQREYQLCKKAKLANDAP